MSSSKGSMWIMGETEDIRSHYNLGRQLGQPGQFGKAVEATKIVPKAGDPTKFAVKIINKARFSRSGRLLDSVFQSFRQEVEIMSAMDHTNVIKFVECFEDRTYFYIVMELCTGGELFDRITAVGRYSERDAAKVLRQLLEGLRYMHSRNIAHCDLKPDNFIFVSEAKDAPIKIIDFGMSKLCTPRRYFRKFCGTPYYVAPEVLDGKYTEACDMWSMGVVMFVMLHGYPPFYADPSVYGGQADERIFQLIRGGFRPIVKRGFGPHFPQTIPISQPAMDLISKLLEPDTTKRFTAVDALDHPWMTGQAPNEPLQISVLRSLKDFNSTNKLKTMVLTSMLQHLSEGEAQSLKASFQALDKDGDGTVTLVELQSALQQFSSDSKSPLAEEFKAQDVQSILQAVDVDGDGKISYEELAITYLARKTNHKEERLYNTFCRLDVNHDGRLSAAELAKAVDGLDEASAKQLLSEHDLDQDGFIDYNEFMELWADKSDTQPAPGSAEAAALLPPTPTAAST